MNLPDTCIECIHTDYSNLSGKNRTILTEFIGELVGADCRALMVDGEILFNSYDKNMLLKDIIMGDVIRDKIIDDAHSSLLFHLAQTNRTQTCNIICIYMFGNQSWMAQIACKFIPELEYEISFYKCADTAWDFLIPV